MPDMLDSTRTAPPTGALPQILGELQPRRAQRVARRRDLLTQLALLAPQRVRPLLQRGQIPLGGGHLGVERVEIENRRATLRFERFQRRAGCRRPGDDSQREHRREGTNPAHKGGTVARRPCKSHNFVT